MSIVSPFEKHLKEKCIIIHTLTNQHRHNQHQKTRLAVNLIKIALKSHTAPKNLTVTEIFEEFKTDMTNIPPAEIITQERNGCTHAHIIASQSKLFFIKYTTENTILQRWCLVQVDLEATSEINKDDSAIDSYYCLFLANHPNDMCKSKKISRFWSECHRLTRYSKIENIIYEELILIRTNHNPDKEKFIQRSDNLSLFNSSHSSHYTIRPFDFEKIGSFNRTRQKVSVENWRLLYNACTQLGIVPPSFGSNLSQKSPVRCLLNCKYKL